MKRLKTSTYKDIFVTCICTCSRKKNHEHMFFLGGGDKDSAWMMVKDGDG